MKLKTIPLYACLGLGLSQAATIYTTEGAGKDFDVSINTPLADVGWFVVNGNDDTRGTPIPSSGAYRSGIFEGAGSGLNDYLYFQKQNPSVLDMDFFGHTSTGSDFVSFFPGDYSSLLATWKVSRSNFGTGGGYYVTVQVGGAWYASTTNAASQPATGTVSIDLLASNWVSILETGTSLTLGTTPVPALLAPGSQITGLGFYVDDLNPSTGPGNTQTLRIDEFTITAVPEPTSSLMVLLGAVSLMGRRRR
jgi:hypothetical protein